jgi:pimeloyl-ACP methyl ester carboxylesterase
VATTFALSENPDLGIDKYVLFTTPNRFEDRVREVSEEVGLSTKSQDILKAKLEEDTGLQVSSLVIENWVKNIRVKEALILHDKNDKVIPIEYSRSVHKAWPHSQLVEIEGTGHYRILRSQKALNTAIEFLSSK